jgi:hypothetical protein
MNGARKLYINPKGCSCQPAMVLSLMVTVATPNGKNRHPPLPRTTGAASVADPTARAPRGSR